MACLLLSACNDKDIDGALKVFKSFVLLDEEGYHLSIAEGTYEAEFSYKTRDGSIEVEIDDVVGGYDRDFIFGTCLPRQQGRHWMRKWSLATGLLVKNHHRFTGIVAKPIAASKAVLAECWGFINATVPTTELAAVELPKNTSTRSRLTPKVNSALPLISSKVKRRWHCLKV